MQSSQQDISDLVGKLNGDLFATPDIGIFTGGQGVVVRNLNDGLQAVENLVVPGSFWHNDIYPPNQIYPPISNIMHGNGPGNLWNTPTLAVAIGSDHHGVLFDVENIQNADWDHGVWYAHDSNCCDQRALWSEDYKGYEAPCAWVDCKLENEGKTITTINEEKFGSGHYSAGNPSSPPPSEVLPEIRGGGTGVHMKYNYFQAKASGSTWPDQIDGKLYDKDKGLVSTHECEIKTEDWGISSLDYYTIDAWKGWIEHFANDAKLYLKEDNTPRYNGESWTANLAMGWLDHPRKMITLQNALWKYRDTWCTGNVPPEPRSYLYYWGWNEIPFKKDDIDKSYNWTCFIIVLPPCEDNFEITLTVWLQKYNEVKQGLIDQLNYYKEHYDFFPGKSQIALVRQIPNQEAKKKDLVDVWMREFFVENLSIGENWSITDGVIQYKDS